MDGLGIDRISAISKLNMTTYGFEQAKAAMKANLQQVWDGSEIEQSEAEDEDEL